ncbi:hypothetical protein Misp01_06510 [Microtetraspora sp. NBRC 13810]|uniref:hypothetical protein n=1 Tax=Microtetraspora sp. NBRC 13810 TaxID=3030990 RepID=UPI0024A0ECCE|nr:hypothetical protein [Microtetraspora sp. NBRC 13810]GLW05521.1 hypothetical protein Misp01_06510 [Microtetraspora sp. NBRC 13810]
MAHEPQHPYGDVWESREERPRRVHRTDWMALLSGILFIVLGIGFVGGDIGDPLTTALPALVAGLGLAGFVAVIARVTRRK